MAKKARSLKIFREAPHGVQIFKAFSMEEMLCQDKREQSHTIPVDAWIFLGYERFFKTVEIAEKAWPCLSLEIRLDGKVVGNPKDYTTGPYAFSLLCPKGERDGFVVGTAIYVPTLPIGDHSIELKTITDCGIDDGWSITPAGTIETFSAVLHVINKHFTEY
jgi:hypothetical protein